MHFRYFALSLLLLPIGFAPAMAQRPENKHLCYSVGAVFDESIGTGAEVALLYDDPQYGAGPCAPPMGYHSPRVGMEFYAPVGNRMIVAPKIGYEFELVIVGVRASVIDYTDLSKHDFRLTPEIGFTLLGLIDFYAGYDIPLTTTCIRPKTGAKVSLSINLDPKM